MSDDEGSTLMCSKCGESFPERMFFTRIDGVTAYPEGKRSRFCYSCRSANAAKFKRLGEKGETPRSPRTRSSAEQLRELAYWEGYWKRDAQLTKSRISWGKYFTARNKSASFVRGMAK